MFASILITVKRIKFFPLLFAGLLLGNGLELESSIIHERVLICGVCRNTESRFFSTKKILESMGRLFDDYRILIYENNSVDRTPKLLHAWKNANPRVWFRSEFLSREELENKIVNINRDGSLFVPEQIARARNIVLEEAFTPLYDDFPYLIWVDMDFTLSPDLDGLIDTFQSQKEWDAVFAYGIAPSTAYWDWYAFRDKNNPIGPELLGSEWYQLEDERKKLRLTRQDAWHPVYSAFGGCGIYKKASIQGCRYSATVTPDLELFYREILKDQSHPQVARYFDLNQHLTAIYRIDEPRAFLPPVSHPDAGIVLHSGPNALIWRMNTFVYQYPSICEHVPFHASMIVRGHDRLFINPKLIFRYGN